MESLVHGIRVLVVQPYTDERQGHLGKPLFFDEEFLRQYTWRFNTERSDDL